MDVVAIMNTVRDNATATYQERIPEATRTNIELIRDLMISDDNVQIANEFVGALLNKLVKSVVHTKMFANPLKTLKKGKKPLGDTVEEIYNNFIKGNAPDATGAGLLSRNLPDTKTIYHRMNFQMQYPVTVDRARLSKAFMSYDALEKYITNLIQTLYNSAELDEFVNMKKMIASALDNNAMKYQEVADPAASDANAKKFLKGVKTISRLMKFPSTEYNGYLTTQTTDTKPITTFTRPEEQVLILDAGTDVSVSVDVLASLFNMSVADFNDTKKIVIDAFPASTKGKVIGCLVDEAFFQVFDDFFAITEFFNGQGIYTNYYLNVWQTMAYSPLVNAVAFVISNS